MPDLIVPDISQYQGDVDWDALNAWAVAQFGGLAVVIRAGYGLSADAKWERNIFEARRVGVRWLGAYWYLNQGTDAASQAHRFVDLLAGRHVDMTAVDIEEGAGDQQPRQHAFLDVMTTDPATDWTYSGLWFSRSRGLDDNYEWVSAYVNAEPSTVHKLWQNSSSYTFPGIAGNVDGSIFHGSIDDLIALTNPGDDMASALLNQAAKSELVMAWYAVLDQRAATAVDRGGYTYWIDLIPDDGDVAAVQAVRTQFFEQSGGDAGAAARAAAAAAAAAATPPAGGVDATQLAKALHDMLKADEITKLQAELAALQK